MDDGSETYLEWICFNSFKFALPIVVDETAAERERRCASLAFLPFIEALSRLADTDDVPPREEVCSSLEMPSIVNVEAEHALDQRITWPKDAKCADESQPLSWRLDVCAEIMLSLT